MSGELIIINAILKIMMAPAIKPIQQAASNSQLGRRIHDLIAGDDVYSPAAKRLVEKSVSDTFNKFNLMDKKHMEVLLTDSYNIGIIVDWFISGNEDDQPPIKKLNIEFASPPTQQEIKEFYTFFCFILLKNLKNEFTISESRSENILQDIHASTQNIQADNTLMMTMIYEMNEALKQNGLTPKLKIQNDELNNETRKTNLDSLEKEETAAYQVFSNPSFPIAITIYISHAEIEIETFMYLKKGSKTSYTLSNEQHRNCEWLVEFDADLENRRIKSFNCAPAFKKSKRVQPFLSYYEAIKSTKESDISTIFFGQKGDVELFSFKLNPVSISLEANTFSFIKNLSIIEQFFGIQFDLSVPFQCSEKEEYKYAKLIADWLKGEKISQHYSSQHPLIIRQRRNVIENWLKSETKSVNVNVRKHRYADYQVLGEQFIIEINGLLENMQLLDAEKLDFKLYMNPDDREFQVQLAPYFFDQDYSFDVNIKYEKVV